MPLWQPTEDDSELIYILAAALCWTSGLWYDLVREQILSPLARLGMATTPDGLRHHSAISSWHNERNSSMSMTPFSSLSALWKNCPVLIVGVGDPECLEGIDEFR